MVSVEFAGGADYHISSSKGGVEIGGHSVKTLYEGFRPDVGFDIVESGWVIRERGDAY